MKFSERNMLLQEINKRFAVEHDKYTSSSKILSEDEWQKYIDTMESLAKEYADGHLSEFVNGICMAYLNDTTEVQKRLKGS